MKIFTYTCLSLLMLGALLPTGGVRAQTVISSQSPCSPGGGECLTFTDSSGPIPTIRSFDFTAPSAGEALVTFHGSLYCASGFTTTNSVVDVVSQIVPGTTDAPAISGPGGLRHAIVLTASSAGTSDTFNLASTRVVNITAPGNTTFSFKMARLRMDTGTQCYVYNAAFTVVFTP